MILVDAKWNSGLYDFDGEVLSKVLKLYNNDDTVRFDRFEYAYNKEDYKEAKETDIQYHKHSYYDDKGNLVFE